MSILVTGYTGFIGSHLIKELVKRNKEVIGISRQNEMPFLFGNNYFKHYKCDITDKKSIKNIFEKEKIDTIIHLAGGGGNVFCMQDPKRSVLTDICGTLNLARLTAKNNAKFIFSSSYIAYSVRKKRTLPFTEEMELQPDDLYGSLKKSAEEIIKITENYIILRLAHIYGYEKGMNRFVTKMIESAKNQKKIEIKGSGNQKFDLLYVDDLCKAIVAVVDSNLKQEILNIGSGSPISINELASKVKNIVNKNAEIKHIEDPSYTEFPDHYMSIEKIKKMTGWQPKITLEEGIRKIIEIYDNAK